MRRSSAWGRGGRIAVRDSPTARCQVAGRRDSSNDASGEAEVGGPRDRRSGTEAALSHRPADRRSQSCAGRPDRHCGMPESGAWRLSRPPGAPLRRLVPKARGAELSRRRILRDHDTPGPVGEACARCPSTVRAVMNRCWAISRLWRPAAASWPEPQAIGAARVDRPLVLYGRRSPSPDRRPALTSCSATTRSSARRHGAKYRRLGARPCPGRLDWADQPDGRVVPLLSRPCGQSVPDTRRLRHRRNGGRACFLLVRRCRSPFRDRLRSFMSYVFSALGQENRRATSITCEGHQSSATTARSQPTST
jgi:hypothetical protein